MEFDDYGEAERAADEMFKKIADIVNKYKAPDMVAEKIIARIGVIGQLGGVTRTTALGAAVFAGIYGCVTGLSKDQLLAMVSELYDVTDAAPGTAEAKQAYAEINAQAHAEAAAKKAALGGDLVDTNHSFGEKIGDTFLAPMPKLKQ